MKELNLFFVEMVNANPVFVVPVERKGLEQRREEADGRSTQSAATEGENGRVNCT